MSLTYRTASSMWEARNIVQWVLFVGHMEISSGLLCDEYGKSESFDLSWLPVVAVI